MFSTYLQSGHGMHDPDVVLWHDQRVDVLSQVQSVKVINNPARLGSIHREINYINYK